MSSPKRRIETDVMKMYVQTCQHLTKASSTDDAGRLMSDYEVTLVNDNMYGHPSCLQSRRRPTTYEVAGKSSMLDSRDLRRRHLLVDYGRCMSSYQINTHIRARPLAL